MADKTTTLYRCMVDADGDGVAVVRQRFRLSWATAVPVDADEEACGPRVSLMKLREQWSHTPSQAAAVALARAERAVTDAREALRRAEDERGTLLLWHRGGGPDHAADALVAHDGAGKPPVQIRVTRHDVDTRTIDLEIVMPLQPGPDVPLEQP